MRIEPAAPADFETVNALARQVHEMHVAWRPDLYRSAEHPFPLDWYSHLLEQGGVWLLREGDQVLGYAACVIASADLASMLPRKVFTIDQLCIAEGFRHQGLGRYFVEGLIERAKAAGCTDLQLTVNPQNKEALAFYEGLGMNVKQIQYHKKL